MERKMPKGYIALWLGIALAYLVWMVGFMKDIVLVNYETAAARTVDGYTYSDITGMMEKHWLYPVWVAISVLTLLLFIVYIKKILYAEKLTNGLKWLCLASCVFGCVFVVWYGFFDAPNKAGEIASFADKVKYITASMIGLMRPWHFRGWGVIGAASVFMNIAYTYRKFDYKNRLGVILGSVGAAAIYMTINCPSMGDESKDFSVPRCTVHWAGALLFAVGCAAPLVLFLIGKAKKEKGRFLFALLVFGGILALMAVLLVTVGKSAIIENIPMVTAYILLFVLNFTSFFPVAAQEPALAK